MEKHLKKLIEVVVELNDTVKSLSDNIESLLNNIKDISTEGVEIKNAVAYEIVNGEKRYFKDALRVDTGL